MRHMTDASRDGEFKGERMSHDLTGRWSAIGGAFVFAVITLFITADILMDHQEGAPMAHLLVEAVILVSAVFGFWTMLMSIRGLRRALIEAREDAGRWQDENRTLVQGLSAAISRQFETWGLSEAEREVGLLLLKGLSLQEIADLRQTSERTVREQARAVYRKGGLSGRNELSAYFLEDLLPDLAG
ncbi:MAG: helix-turn-helix transcriptional regulator [Hyphomonas sp.]